MAASAGYLEMFRAATGKEDGHCKAVHALVAAMEPLSGKSSSGKGSGRAGLINSAKMLLSLAAPHYISPDFVERNADNPDASDDGYWRGMAIATQDAASDLVMLTRLGAAGAAQEAVCAGLLNLMTATLVSWRHVESSSTKVKRASATFAFHRIDPYSALGHLTGHAPGHTPSLRLAKWLFVDAGACFAAGGITSGALFAADDGLDLEAMKKCATMRDGPAGGMASIKARCELDEVYESTMNLLMAIQRSGIAPRDEDSMAHQHYTSVSGSADFRKRVILSESPQGLVENVIDVKYAHSQFVGPNAHVVSASVTAAYTAHAAILQGSGLKPSEHLELFVRRPTGPEAEGVVMPFGKSDFADARQALRHGEAEMSRNSNRTRHASATIRLLRLQEAVAADTMTSERATMELLHSARYLKDTDEMTPLPGRVIDVT